MDRSGVLAELRERRIVAIVRGLDPDDVLQTVRAVVDAGIGMVEVPLTTPGALDIVETAVRELAGRAMVGVGTVLTDDDVRGSMAAGAAFAVTPAVTAAVARCAEVGLPVLAGALTPTEIAAAVGAGASAVKLFPASLGGPDYLRALRDPFPQVPFVPVGGVDAARAEEFLAAGAVAIGVGSPLVGVADLIAERAARFLRAVA